MSTNNPYAFIKSEKHCVSLNPLLSLEFSVDLSLKCTCIRRIFYYDKFFLVIY